jgi:hypothetical protein
MKYTVFVIAGIFVLACMVMPASAFTMKSLDVTVGPNGDAVIDAQYDLSFLEQSAVYFQLADPSQQLQSAFNSKTSAPVTVESVSPNAARISVPSYTSVKNGDDGITYTTPVLSFERARTALKSYWFAPLVSLDFSKGVTTVTFPDGYQEQFTGQISIPSVSHTLP